MMGAIPKWDILAHPFVTIHCFGDLFVLPCDAFEQMRSESPQFRDVLKKMSADKTEKMEMLVMDGVIL